jgi:glyoxylase-like metal-dependent hydrolase (beta-lactamase superfamily II)
MNFDTFRFRLGNFSCMAIKDAAARYPAAMFLTNLDRDQYEPELRRRGQDPEQIELPYTCLYIDTGLERLLVDTGKGVDGPEPGNLLLLLQEEGIEPHQIETVILSHAHPDHIGGCLNNLGRTAFPNAKYVMLRKEWDYWTSNPSLAELPLDEGFRKMMLASAQKNLSAIQRQLDLIDPETEIVPGIVAIAAFGHSPGQMGLEISSAGHRLLFVADAIVLPLHLAYPGSIGATDHRPREMVATRINILGKAARDQPMVSISHFAFPGLGYIAARGDRWEWRVVAGSAEASEAGCS